MPPQFADSPGVIEPLGGAAQFGSPGALCVVPFRSNPTSCVQATTTACTWEQLVPGPVAPPILDSSLHVTDTAALSTVV